MLTARATWTGLIVLLLVMLLITVAVFYWHHVTGASLVHLFGFFPKPDTTHGC